MNWDTIRTWDRVLDHFEEYASSRKNELNSQSLTRDAGLIKSYMIETQRDGIKLDDAPRSLRKILQSTNWRITPLDHELYYRVSSSENLIGFIEIVSPRYFVLHSMQKSNDIDASVRNAVKNTSKLDVVWLAGTYLELIWKLWISNMVEKFVAFKFEHQGTFERFSFEDDYDLDDEQLADENEYLLDEAPIERPSSTLSINASVKRIRSVLPELQRIWPDFKAIKMLRTPASEAKGGYDFWDWGKVTYRSSSFLDGRAYLTNILETYSNSTEEIEERVWFKAENNQISDGHHYVSFRGTPVTIVLSKPMNDETFQNFIKTTFVDGRGPFRLWGDPIFRNNRNVHVYGVDLHLWQQIYLDLTPSRFIVILPTGTCGNSIHRLISNIQRFMSPDIVAYIGDYPYTQLLQSAILQK